MPKKKGVESFHCLDFLLDGEGIGETDTAEQLALEDNDQIDCFTPRSAC